MKKVWAVILASALVGVIAACSAQDTGRPAVSVRGEITSRMENEDGSVSIQVDGEKEPDTEYDRAIVKVTDKTTVMKSGEECLPDVLQVGAQVEVRFAGPVMESYPVQGEASGVAVLTGD